MKPPQVEPEDVSEDHNSDLRSVAFLGECLEVGTDLRSHVSTLTNVLTFSLRRALNSCSFLWAVSMWEKRAALPRTQGCCRASRTLRRFCGSRTISLLT